MKENSLTVSSSLTLDLIRIMASQAVLVGHSFSFFKLFPALKPPNFEYIQNIAVVVFFILSGFLITYTIFNKVNKSDYSFTHYLIDRFARIYSGYIPAIVFIIIIDLVNKSLNPKYGYGKAFNLKTLLGNLFMLQNYPFINFAPFGSARPLWTVAIEWWIYLSVGWLIFRICKKKLTITDLLIFAVLSVVPCFNLLYKSKGHGLTLVWITGAVIFLLIEKYQNKNKVINSILSLIFLLLAFQRLLETKSAYEMRFVLLLSISLYFLLSILQQINFSHNFAYKKIIRFLAGYSFTLYLIHYSILDLVRGTLTGKCPPIYLLVISFFVTNALAAIIAMFTEMKHKKLADYLKKVIKF